MSGRRRRSERSGYFVEPIMAAPRRTLVCGLEQLSRIEDALRIERRLDALHHVVRGAVLERHVALAHRTRPVLSRDGPADLEREAVEPIGELVRAPHLVGVG